MWNLSKLIIWVEVDLRRVGSYYLQILEYKALREENWGIEQDYYESEDS